MGINIHEIINNIPKSDDTGDVGKEYDNVDIQLKQEQLREAKLKNAALEENKGDSQDRDQRKEFAERIFFFCMSLYVCCFFNSFLVWQS